jgi:DNA modification methylase
MTTRILVGDCRDVLPTLPDQSVQCVVTSPPYFGLRDYGTAYWHGGDAECDHRAPSRFDYPLNPGLGPTGVQTQASNRGSNGTAQYRDTCGKCGAVRIDRQIGLESTVDAYVEALVGIFREVRRILRDDGTVWLNLGDTYVGGGRGAHGGIEGRLRRSVPPQGVGNAYPKSLRPKHTDNISTCTYKHKDLIGIPWRVAFALQADGWYLRSDIVWNKPNPMPESVTDRPTRSHEYVFLLTKRARYFFDAEAVREPHQAASIKRVALPLNTDRQRNYPGAPQTLRMGDEQQMCHPAGRNIRSVWTIATKPYADAHFATFPPALVEPCIKAGTSERGCCPTCGAGWVREVERISTGKSYAVGKSDAKRSQGLATAFSGYDDGSSAPSFRTVGWRPGCTCDGGQWIEDTIPNPAYQDGDEWTPPTITTRRYEPGPNGAPEPVPCVVLDPFGGAGTAGLVADRLGRDSILIELNPEYAALARKRITGDAPMFATVEVER